MSTLWMKMDTWVVELVIESNPVLKKGRIERRKYATLIEVKRSCVVECMATLQLVQQKV